MIDKIENYILEHSDEPNFLDSYRVYLVSEGINNIEDAILGDEQITDYSNRILHGEMPSTEMYEYFHKVSGNDFSAIENYPEPEILMSLALDARMIDESEYKKWYEDKELEKYLAPYPTKAELIDRLGPSLQEILDDISDEDAPKILESIDTPLATWQLTSSNTDPEDFGIRGSIRKMLNTIKRAKTKQAKELELLKETQNIIDREMSAITVNDIASSLSMTTPGNIVGTSLTGFATTGGSIVGNKVKNVVGNIIDTSYISKDNSEEIPTPPQSKITPTDVIKSVSYTATREGSKVANKTKDTIGNIIDSTDPKNQKPQDSSEISDKIESNLKNVTKDSKIQSSDDNSSENVDSHGISMGLNEMNNQNDQSARDMASAPPSDNTKNYRTEIEDRRPDNYQKLKAKKKSDQGFIKTLGRARDNIKLYNRRRKDEKAFDTIDKRNRESLLKGDADLVVDEFGNKSIKKKGALDRFTNKMVDKAPELAASYLKTKAIESARLNTQQMAYQNPQMQPYGYQPQGSVQINIPNGNGNVQRSFSESDFDSDSLDDLKKYGLGLGVGALAGIGFGSIATMKAVRQAELRREMENARLSTSQNDWVYIPSDPQVARPINMSIINRVHEYMHSDFSGYTQGNEPSTGKKIVGTAAKAAVYGTAAYAGAKLASDSGFKDKVKEAFSKNTSKVADAAKEGINKAKDTVVDTAKTMANAGGDESESDDSKINSGFDNLNSFTSKTKDYLNSDGFNKLVDSGSKALDTIEHDTRKLRKRVGKEFRKARAATNIIDKYTKPEEKTVNNYNTTNTSNNTSIEAPTQSNNAVTTTEEKESYTPVV